MKNKCKLAWFVNFLVIIKDERKVSYIQFDSKIIVNSHGCICENLVV